MDINNIKGQVNDRFLYAVEELLSKKIVKNKAVLAKTFGIKPSSFSEILHGRTNASVDMLAILCFQYRISPDWLLTNVGDMFRNSEENFPLNTSASNDKNDAVIDHYIRLVNEKDSKIICQAEEIGKLKERISQFERQKNTP